jgi:hypothetical protein
MPSAHRAYKVSDRAHTLSHALLVKVQENFNDNRSACQA